MEIQGAVTGRQSVALDHTPRLPAPFSGWSNIQANRLKVIGAGEGIRTLDPDLGKVVLYH
jgi:hypothetical protein